MRPCLRHGNLASQVITCSDRILKTREDAKHMLDAVKYLVDVLSKNFTAYQEFCVHDLNKPLDPNNSFHRLKNLKYFMLTNLYSLKNNFRQRYVDDVAPDFSTPIQP